MTIVENRPEADSLARKAMINGQLRTSGINAENVLNRFADVAREDFVPASARGFAYADRAIALGNGRFLAGPVVQGMMLQEANPTAADKALLVDGGSGYLAALLKPMVGSLDVVTPAEAAALSGTGDYTLIMIDGAVEQVPANLANQLTADGRLITGVSEGVVTRLAIGRRSGTHVALLNLLDIGIPVLPEFAAPKAWAF